MNLGDYPMSFAFGRKVFAWSEVSLNPLLTEQDWVLYPVFPGEQVGMGSAARLLATARNTLASNRNTTWSGSTTRRRYSASPPRAVGSSAGGNRHGRFYFFHRGLNHFQCGGGNVEGAGIADGINAMLLQSHEGFLRLFPCWHHPAAKFGTLRAAGAFLVSAEKKDGVCSHSRC